MLVLLLLDTITINMYSVSRGEPRTSLLRSQRDSTNSKTDLLLVRRFYEYHLPGDYVVQVVVPSSSTRTPALNVQ